MTPEESSRIGSLCQKFIPEAIQEITSSEPEVVTRIDITFPSNDQPVVCERCNGVGVVDLRSKSFSFASQVDALNFHNIRVINPPEECFFRGSFNIIAPSRCLLYNYNDQEQSKKIQQILIVVRSQLE